jgi:hypoxanthine phosphoribosyltransferase
MDSEPKLTLLFSGEEIAATVKKLAAAIGRDYRDKHPLFIGVLKGSFMFMADLIRLLDFPLEVEFIRLSSYGGGKSPGKIKLLQDVQSNIEGRHVLVIEDIIDTGLTTTFVLEHLKKKKPASLKLCSLTDKLSRRKVPVNIDYLGLNVPNKFIVGYGIDWNERFRYLPGIYAIEGKD